jgi:hypothetical protein
MMVTSRGRNCRERETQNKKAEIQKEFCKENCFHGAILEYLSELVDLLFTDSYIKTVTKYLKTIQLNALPKWSSERNNACLNFFSKS